MDPEVLMKVAAELGGCQGRDQAIHRMDLARACGISGRKVQEAVELLVKDQYLPIGSSSKLGYWMIVDREDLIQAEANLEGRALKILKRLSRLRGVSMKKLCGQLALVEYEGDVTPPSTPADSGPQKGGDVIALTGPE